MRRIALTLFSVLIADHIALTLTEAAGQQPTFKSGARTVAVYATVTDAQGRLVPDLAREDFEIYDNGKPQPISIFSNEIQPITVVIMLDRSGSMQASFRLIEAAGEAFVRLMGPGDKARIGSFAARIKVDPESFTNNQDELVRILRTELQHEGPTPLWNAVNVAITSLLPEDGRRVVLVFTDGADNPGNFKLNNTSILDVIDRAQRDNVMVYAVGLASTEVPGLRGRGGFGGFGGGRTLRQGPDPSLPTIAAETGGGYFELTRAEDLRSTFARVADELHRQYMIGFEPEKLDDKTHKLELRVKKPGLQARARKNYRASRERSS
jgi:Ca-activated chloride channel homolog